VTDEEPDESPELVMPFVAVASVGGPYDDLAYAAGWEMGALNATLAGRDATVMHATIKTGNFDQADLVAMNNGYRIAYFRGDPESGSVRITLTRVVEAS
jgi:hypothetical protein